jgi:tetratricopeptide (TPR) repeat protein
VARGAFDESIESNLRAIEEFDRLGQATGLVTGYCNVAEALMLAGRLDEALDYSEKAVDLARRLRHDQALADITKTRASIFLTQGRFEEAARLAEDAARLGGEMNLHPFTEDSLRLAAEAWTKAGHEDRARDMDARATSMPAITE